MKKAASNRQQVSTPDQPSSRPPVPTTDPEGPRISQQPPFQPSPKLSSISTEIVRSAFSHAITTSASEAGSILQLGPELVDPLHWFSGPVTLAIVPKAGSVTTNLSFTLIVSASVSLASKLFEILHSPQLSSLTAATTLPDVLTRTPSYCSSPTSSMASSTAAGRAFPVEFTETMFPATNWVIDFDSSPPPAVYSATVPLTVTSSPTITSASAPHQQQIPFQPPDPSCITNAELKPRRSTPVTIPVV